MIKLTRLGGEPFILNADLIRYVEARPDTFITLTIGDRIVVEESMDEVLSRAIDYQRAKYLIPLPAGDLATTPPSESPPPDPLERTEPAPWGEAGLSIPMDHCPTPARSASQAFRDEGSNERLAATFSDPALPTLSVPPPFDSPLFETNAPWTLPQSPA